MASPALDRAALRRAVEAALEEDLDGRGDLTTDAVIPTETRATGHFVARGDLVVAGVGAAREIYESLDRSLFFQVHRREGERVRARDRLASVTGRARPILTGERTALNFLMRMCGIATSTRAAVEEVAGTGAVILDTRKTAPGLRLLDKYAVAVGGGANHRLGLYDAVMIKDTHLAVAGPLREAIGRAVARGHPAPSIVVEVGNVEELDEAIRAGAGRALLDNMDLAAIRECVERARGRIVLEASGGLRPGGLRPVAETGVSFISVGWLTHSAPAADLALDLEPIA